jgi:hypothetical protein
MIQETVREITRLPQREQEVFIQELRQIRTAMTQLAYEVPEQLRDAMVSEEWTIKDVIAHISGWDTYTIHSLKAFLRGDIPEWGGDVEDFNRQQIESRSGLSWEELVAEFEDTGYKMVQAYSQVPGILWEKPIWPDQEITPKQSLQDDIYHYGQEHLPQFQILAQTSDRS